MVWVAEILSHRKLRLRITFFNGVSYVGKWAEIRFANHVNFAEWPRWHRKISPQMLS